MISNRLLRILQGAVALFILFLAYSPAAAQQVYTFSDKDSLEVGELFELTFVIQGDYSSIVLPEEDQFPEDLELISRQRYQPGSNRDSLVYQFQFFGTEDLILPSVAFRLISSAADTTINSSRLPLYFKTVLSEENESFKPFKPIFDFAIAIWPWILGILILIVAGYYLYMLYSKQEPEPEPVQKIKPDPFMDPLVQLRQILDRLPDPGSLQRIEEFESFYVLLGDSIRSYIKRVYRFPALEMTTREIVIELEKKGAPSSTVKITRTVLNEADMVKFANFKPDSDLAFAVLRRANEFYDLAITNDRKIIETLRQNYEQMIKESSVQGENQNDDNYSGKEKETV